MPRLHFSLKNFVIFLVILLLEVVIALAAHDGFIRPYIGDFLIIYLMYFFLRTFLAARSTQVIVAVLIFAYAVEVFQASGIGQNLFEGRDQLKAFTIGSVFDWVDIAVYTASAATLYLWERHRMKPLSLTA